MKAKRRRELGGYRTVSRDRGGTWRGESGRGGPYRRRGIGFGWGLFWWMQRVQGFVTPNCHRSSTPDAPVAPARLEFSIVASSHSGIFLIAYYLLLLHLLLMVLLLMPIPFRTEKRRDVENGGLFWWDLDTAIVPFTHLNPIYYDLQSQDWSNDVKLRASCAIKKKKMLF